MDETKYRLGWKVLTPEKKSSHWGTLRYKVGEWTYPKRGHGPLCVFKTRQTAQNFGNGDTLIMPCLYVPSTTTKVWDDFGTVKPLYELPDGKALAECVMLLEAPLTRRYAKKEPE